ncbi:hypothetical protein GCM10010517_23580 [Streptosporangium fragile]|uniref:Uncharacterized protein n=1 Tax=Streptosporangium fragile TaxID=46186 RepID=A0ABP6ID99_9ACTN
MPFVAASPAQPAEEESAAAVSPTPTATASPASSWPPSRSCTYAQAGLRIDVKRARVSKPGEPDTLTRAEQGRLERAAARCGARDRVTVATPLYAGARVEECARPQVPDVILTSTSLWRSLWTANATSSGCGPVPVARVPSSG